ncbi:autotransporter outer membrane beta-barrel domain-containing protein [Bartonella doshiae]|uniref:autotransporter outer membrane beta-barrel domain-containing protein n=2 Tax=Bartonella doshiae TaxID=33044 RepID=UPI001ABAB296|nr:autotransporter outer membrane beta-barrel domain-containing protein [Bartonella doshiae]
MSKKSLLSCTTAAAIILFGLQLNAHAKTLEISGNKTENVSDDTYEYIELKSGAKLIGKNLIITGKEREGQTNKGLSASYKASVELSNTTIKGDGIRVGIEIWHGSTINMTGGSITVSSTGAIIHTDDSGKSKLENVVISTGKDGNSLNRGIDARTGKLTLKNITVTKANKAIDVMGGTSEVTVSGGSFGGEISANGTISLNDNVTVTSENNGLHAYGEQSKITMAGGTVKGQKSALLTENAGYIDVTDITLTADDKGTGAKSIGQNSMIDLHDNTTIKEAAIGLKAENNGVIQMTGGSITVSETGASFENNKNDKNKLENVVIASSSNDSPMSVGVSADNKSTVALKNITVKNAEKALFANDNSQITVTGGGSFGGEVQAKQGSTITLNDNVTVASENNALRADGEQSKITMAGGSVNAKEAAFVVKDGGQIDIKDIASAKAERNGIRFDDSQNDKTSEINLNNTKLFVENGTGIVSTGSSNGKLNLKDSKIHADTLFTKIISDKKSDSFFTLTAENSLLQGEARNNANGKTVFDLKNNTKWLITTSTKEKDEEGNPLNITQRSRSDISILNLNDSTIAFNAPTEDHYHTLHIGSKKPNTQAVYNASGDAKISFNVGSVESSDITDQENDRLLIQGDVSGTTIVSVMSDFKDSNNITEAFCPSSNTSGVSLIQVSGKATKDSFKLANGYIQETGSPYRYRLTAYGPTSSYGVANETQNLFEEKNENFWDFRLQKLVLPQVASYLALPNALFYAGFIDMAKQSASLANARTAAMGIQDNDKIKGFFLSSYGSIATLYSQQYAYNTNIRYAATQAGFTASAQDGQNTTIYWGLTGTYAQLSLSPKDIEDSEKSTLDKWSVTAYSGIEHNSGFYMDTLFSYGSWKGNISTAIAKNTAKIDDTKMLIASTTIGQKFTMGIQGLTFEPQAQLMYQRLIFNTILDADNLKIDIGEPSQGLARIGGRLTKTVSAKSNRSISFYGKVDLIKTFGDEDTIQVGDTFSLDPTGTSLEGGVGINANLSQNFSLHADVSYRQKLQKAGISGADFSAGIRYQF